MKSWIWAAILAVLVVICAVSAYFLMTPGSDASEAQILSSGQVIRTVDLSVDQQFTVSTENGGYNIITVRDGQIGVTDASCPDHYCMHRGFCDRGTAIVCLPNQMIIQFLDTQEVDGAVG